MRWKAWLATFLILAMLALFFLPNLSNVKKYIKAPISISSLLAYFYPSPTGKEFGISLTTSFSMLKNQEFSIINGTLFYDGNCFVNMGDISFSGVCSLSSFSVNGKLKISNGIEIEAEPSQMKINNLTISHKGGQIFLTSIKDFSLVGISAREIKLLNINGYINNTASGATQPLANNNLKILNFVGSLTIRNNKARLVGIATLVEGDNFVWKG